MGVRTGDGIPDGTKGNGVEPYHKIANGDGPAWIIVVPEDGEKI